MRRRSNNGRNDQRTKGKKAGWRQALSIGLLAFVVAIVMGGPVGAILQDVNLVTGVLTLILVIGLAIVADVIAVAATAAQEVPFHAMATDRVPGSQEALYIVR